MLLLEDFVVLIPEGATTTIEVPQPNASSIGRIIRSIALALLAISQALNLEFVVTVGWMWTHHADRVLHPRWTESGNFSNEVMVLENVIVKSCCTSALDQHSEDIRDGRFRCSCSVCYIRCCYRPSIKIEASIDFSAGSPWIACPFRNCPLLYLWATAGIEHDVNITISCRSITHSSQS